jgi:glycosyltransferase involved in cell wall biosynthesis
LCGCRMLGWRVQETMIYVRFPTGDHGWGVVGDSLTAALERITPLRRLPLDEPVGVVPGPLLLHGGLNAPPAIMATRRVAYVVFEEDLLARRVAREIYGRFDAVATSSRWCETALRASGLPNVNTIQHGVDGRRFHPALATRQRLRDRFVVFSGGKFELRKGQDIVLRAFKVLAERHADVFLVAAWHNGWKRFARTMADSPHYPLTKMDFASFDLLVRQWVMDTGLPSTHIELVPALGNAELPDIYANSDLGLFANRCEGATNLMMMEYMACGRPVIATDFSGHRDVLTDANSVRLRRLRIEPVSREGEIVAEWCEPDLEEIIESLEWAYRRRDQLQAMGQAAAVGMTQWTWDRAARSFLDLLQPSQERIAAGPAVS